MFVELRSKPGAAWVGSVVCVVCVRASTNARPVGGAQARPHGTGPRAS